MDPQSTKTAKVTIDGTVYPVTLFTIGNSKQLSTDIRLEPGTHTLTKIEVFDGDTLTDTKETTLQFTLQATFPTEIPVSFGAGSFAMRAVAVSKAPVYLTMPEAIPPPQSLTAKITGLLGVPDEDKQDYEQDLFYYTRPIKDKIKLAFDLRVFEKSPDGTIIQNSWFYANWAEEKPLNIHWNPATNGNTIKLLFQMYYVSDDGTGGRKVLGHGCMTNCTTWVIELTGNDVPLHDEDGVTTITLFPPGWLSNAHFKWEYINIVL